MFSGSRAVASPFAVRGCGVRRRRSELLRAIHDHFSDPPQMFSNKVLDEIVNRFYWTLRAVQFRIFFKLEEADANSLNELSKFEPAERPPTLNQLKAYTSNRFSEKWIKYMYSKFKNECPTGRMRLSEFKRLFGAYVPDRVSDAYLERLFCAFCYTSPYEDQLTFKDLMECLSTLCHQDARTDAEWTMRLINGGKMDQVSPDEFNEFVKSVFLLVGQNEQKRKRLDSIYASCESKHVPMIPLSSVPLPSSIVNNSDRKMLNIVSRRATAVFKELDVNEQGFLTVENLEELFRSKEAYKTVFWPGQQ
ncbi:kv channel-interacting protein 1 [Ditylenchus destructor]|uniref:Kv channel-interacting protein 1 n=1 Tax=Ditylenchus destructor TaxID=166010 RepID=A0AAD4NFH4_9BILA|nr:kv channel-interacting protein 1 [Ditylenchus destructor]